MRWQSASVVGITRLTRSVSSFLFKLPQPFAFEAGQHVVVRLTAPDGYRAQRSYSIASAPDGSDMIELAIERLENGEVSPFFHEVVATGDLIEIGGPIGGHFVWKPEDGGPVLLIGGGAGVVPLVSMARSRALRADRTPMTLLHSARAEEDLLFRAELDELAGRRDGFELVVTLTRQNHAPAGVRTGRIDAAMIAEAAPTPPRHVFICGSNSFCEATAEGALSAGIPADRIRTERYGA